MSRPVKKLFDIEIDEVSVVDRPANQHGLIAIAKNAGEDTQEGQMDLFDANGNPVDADELEFGDVVFDVEGNEYEFAAEEEVEEEQLELAGVGKAAPNQVMRGLKSGLGGWNESGLGKPGKAAQWVGRNPKKAGAGAAGAAALTAGGGYAMSKSLGDDVLEQLSKAVTDADREEIIAKALNEVSVVKAENEFLAKALEAEQDARITEAFISKAAEYNLPVAPGVLGPILKAVAEVLTDEELDVLDQLFTSVGDTLYDEIGYVGDTDNVSVLDQVNAVASELVGKAAGSQAEAMVALFEANPAAYDAYLAENGR